MAAWHRSSKLSKIATGTTRRLPSLHVTVKSDVPKKMASDRAKAVVWLKARIKCEIWGKVGCDIWEKWVGGRKQKT